MAIKQTDNPSISEKHQKTVKEEEKKKDEFSSLASRLMQRAHDITFTVPLDDGLEIEIYQPTDSELIDLIKLQADVYSLGKSAKGKVSDDFVFDGVRLISDGYAKVATLLGKLCVDESLDEEFFRSGAISAKDKGAIITGIVKNATDTQKK
jgi:dGTP triphosphohydrolase